MAIDAIRSSNGSIYLIATIYYGIDIILVIYGAQHKDIN